MNVKLETVKLDKLHLNNGQVEGLPKNPRFIKDDRFSLLVKSIEESPEMLKLREIVAYDNNGELVVIMGNMRLRAMKELGIKETVAKILPQDTPVEKLKEYTIKDNVAFGSTDWDCLANEWDLEELTDWGVECSFLKEEPTDDVVEEETKKESKDLSDEIKSEFKIEVDCVNETEQEELYNKLVEEGYECRILTL